MDNDSAEKKLKFRSISTTADPNYALNRVDDVYLPRPRSKSEYKFHKLINKEESSDDEDEQNPSLWEFLGNELLRSYALENDQEQYSARREKVYTFIKIPREVEKFMAYGFMQCADSFLFVYTYLPIRFILAVWTCFSRLFRRKSRPILSAAQTCDLLKGCLLVVCSFLMSYIDTSVMYHLIKSQSVIKLYMFYNMLEVGDRLLSACGQDVIDALFWTSTEPRDRKREHLGTLSHLIFAVLYVFLHALLVLCQAATLNVAINSSNKILLTIMMSNNFVELKGSVFKKFDKNNLYQASCSDIRERFHIVVLLFIVVIQTMKEYSWKEETLWFLFPDCLVVLGCELLVDWVKHGFITRFNELPIEVYRDYTLSLAYDIAQTRQKNAFSDHSDLVARRMGFIPLPLGVVMVRVFSTSFKFNTLESLVVAGVFYLTLHSVCILNNLIILSKASDLIDRHQQEREKEERNKSQNIKDSATSPTRPFHHPDQHNNHRAKQSVTLVEPIDQLNSSNLSSTAIFANSTVSMDDMCLNDEMLQVGVRVLESIGEDDALSKSQPNIQLIPEGEEEPLVIMETEGLKRAESEPSLVTATDGVLPSAQDFSESPGSPSHTTRDPSESVRDDNESSS